MPSYWGNQYRIASSLLRPKLAALLSLTVFHITFQVAEPAGLAHRLRPPANGVTGQGLGEGSAATGAGNLVLGDVGFYLNFRLDLSLSFI